MAKFRIGGRVRKMCRINLADLDPLLPTDPVGVPVGAEGTITEIRDDGSYNVLYDHHISQACTGWYRAMPYMLAPLVDPDTWALEAVRKVTTPNRQIAYDAIREEAKRELQETLREQSR